MVRPAHAAATRAFRAGGASSRARDLHRRTRPAAHPPPAIAAGAGRRTGGPRRGGAGARDLTRTRAPLDLRVQPAYIASIRAAYFSAIGRRLSFMVGVSTSLSGSHISARMVNFLICSTRLSLALAA